MSDGVAGVMVRMQQLDAQLRTVAPGWTGISPELAGMTGSGWATQASFGAALTAAAAPATVDGSGSASLTPAPAATSATTSTDGTSTPGGATAAAVLATVPTATTSGGALRSVALNPSWALPVTALHPRETITAASRALTASTTGAAVAAGKGVGGGIAFRLPVAGARVTQGFGPTSLSMEPAATIDGVHYRHFHVGIDYAAAEGTPVTAAADGVVTLAGRVGDGAVDVMIKHATGVTTLYGHLEPGLEVHVGQKVKAGQVLGKVGMTGNTTGPHLHFALSRGGVPIDPAPLFARGVLPGIGKGTASTDGAGSTSAIGGPNLAAFDKVANEIPFAREIRAAAVEAGIDPLLLASLVNYESGSDPKAVSRCGAMGLTQLMPFTAKSLGVTDAFDPAQNLRGGAKWLAGNLKVYGRVDLALAAYQSGRGTVDQAGGMPASKTTRNYVNGIVGLWNRWLRKGSA